MSEFEATVRELARKYALDNAVKHGGRANPGAVIGKIMAESPELRPRAKEIPGIANAAIAEVNAMDAAAQQAAFGEVEGTLVQREKPKDDHPLKPLPNAEAGKVVMRFAPNPSGPATLGHARGMVTNWSYRERYQGKLILRFDDTDATVKRPMMEAYDWIPEDFEWLCGKPDLVIKASERVELYYEVAREVFVKGGAYVCECEAEAFRTLKAAAQPCPHRDTPIAVSIEKWEKMLAGGYQPGEATVRIKTDIEHKDPALRDWVAFRLARDPHPLVGDKYRVWPVLDFQSAVDDHDTGVTHIIRGKDLMDSTRKQRFLYDHLGWTYPETLYWGRVSVHEFGKFSKSILGEAIKRGEYAGWDDPRLPTLRAMRRRGFTAEGITNFWLGFGLSEKDVAASIVTLEAENKKILEPLANRYFFVADPVELTLVGAPALDARPLMHPDHPGRGQRHIHLEPGARIVMARGDVPPARGPVRLKDLCNVDVDPEDTTATFAGNELAWIRENRAPIVHWAPVGGIPATLVLPDATRVEGIAEAALADAEVGAHVQLERVGFARVDEKHEDGRVTLYFTHP